MDFNTYQKKALQTAIFPQPMDLEWVYPALGLANESGEVLGKLKKVMRDDNFVITPEKRAALEAELGDVLWYLAALAASLGLGLEEIAVANVEKLAARQAKGTLQGSGDNR